MSDARRTALDAAEISQQAACLAAHLHRSGVAFLPTPNADRVAWWAEQFRAQQPDATPENKASEESSSDLPAGSTGSAKGDLVQPSTGTKGVAPRRVVPASRLQTAAAFDAGLDAYDGDAFPLETRRASLRQLSEETDRCVRCEVLSSCRRRVVFGEGNPQARFLFFGEGPGADEDRTGRPFVGPAGRLLNKMIAACTLDRQQCYITNTVKCRPPDNRNPEHDEIENCRAYYQRQFELIRPEYIVCLGAVAASELLRTKLSVGRLRGKLHTYRGSKVLVTYHPAYLLRNPAAKKAAWQDLQFLMADAGIVLP